jgi:hypothetical protein
MPGDEAAGCNYLFGYGSIINNESRLATGGSAVAACVRIDGSGFERCWNFRSTTGFTALGLQKVAAQTKTSKAPPINGIIFPVGNDMDEVSMANLLLRIPPFFVYFPTRLSVRPTRGRVHAPSC